MLLDIGWVSLIGILVLFASFPVNAVVARKMGECQRKVSFNKTQDLIKFLPLDFHLNFTI